MTSVVLKHPLTKLENADHIVSEGPGVYTWVYGV